MTSKARLVPMLCLAAALLAAPFARGATANVVLSQVFAGGGNSGAPFANDFVELFNRSAGSVDVSGWTVQYASAASTSWQATALSGTIAPGRYLLVQLASGGTAGAALPSPDATGTADVDVDIQPVLSIALERSTISFGHAFSGDTPAPISERVTVVSNNAPGYSLSVHRTAFVPGDLPLGIAPSAGAAIQPIPIAPAADLLLATTATPSAAAGDVWPTSIGFSAPLPVVTPAHYTATVTFTVIGR